MPEGGGVKQAREVRPGHPLVELTLARVRELMREPEAVFWVFVFPILLAGILGLAFRSRPPDALPVAVVRHGGRTLPEEIQHVLRGLVGQLQSGG